MKYSFVFILIVLLFSNEALANHTIRELSSALWLRPQTHLFNELCHLAKQECNVDNYSIDPLTDTVTPILDDFKIYLTDYSAENLKTIPLDGSTWKKQLLHLMKEAGVETTPEAKRIFQELVQSVVNIQDGFSPTFLGAISYCVFNQHEYLILVITNPKYQTSEALVFSVLRKE